MDPCGRPVDPVAYGQSGGRSQIAKEWRSTAALPNRQLDSAGVAVARLWTAAAVHTSVARSSRAVSNTTFVTRALGDYRHLLARARRFGATYFDTLMLVLKMRPRTLPSGLVV